MEVGFKGSAMYLFRKARKNGGDAEVAIYLFHRPNVCFPILLSAQL